MESTFLLDVGVVVDGLVLAPIDASRPKRSSEPPSHGPAVPCEEKAPGPSPSSSVHVNSLHVTADQPTTRRPSAPPLYYCHASVEAHMPVEAGGGLPPPIPQKIFPLSSILPWGFASPRTVFSTVGRHTNKGLVVAAGPGKDQIVVCPYWLHRHVLQRQPETAAVAPLPSTLDSYEAEEDRTARANTATEEAFMCTGEERRDQAPYQLKRFPGDNGVDVGPVPSTTTSATTGARVVSGISSPAQEMMRREPSAASFSSPAPAAPSRFPVSFTEGVRRMHDEVVQACLKRSESGGARLAWKRFWALARTAEAAVAAAAAVSPPASPASTEAAWLESLEVWPLTELRLAPSLSPTAPTKPLPVGAVVLARRLGGGLEVGDIIAARWDITYSVRYRSDGEIDSGVLHRDIHVLDRRKTEKCSVRDVVLLKIITDAESESLPGTVKGVIVEALGGGTFRFRPQRSRSGAEGGESNVPSADEWMWEELLEVDASVHAQCPPSTTWVSSNGAVEGPRSSTAPDGSLHDNAAQWGSLCCLAASASFPEQATYRTTVVSEHEISHVFPLLSDALFADPEHIRFFRQLDPEQTGWVTWRDTRELIRREWVDGGEPIRDRYFNQWRTAIAAARRRRALLSRDDDAMPLNFAEFEYVLLSAKTRLQ